jgi:hypothetical protein
MARARGRHDETSFADLDPLAIRQIASFFTTALDLSRAARACCELRTACVAEAQERARSRICLSWKGAIGVPPHEACANLQALVQSPVSESGRRIFVDAETHELWHRPWETNDVLALATKFAGGWCALLAGREAPIKPAPAAAATRVKPVGDEVVFGALVLSDVVQDGATIWSGVAPLLDHIGDSRAWCTDPPLPAPGDDPADDPAHEYVTDACNLNLLGPNLPGAVIECEWDDREFMGPIPADWPSHMCATVQELQAKSWQFRFSVVAPNSGEILAYTSPDVGPVLAAFFRRSADAEQGIQRNSCHRNSEK